MCGTTNFKGTSIYTTFFTYVLAERDNQRQPCPFLRRSVAEVSPERRHVFRIPALCLRLARLQTLRRSDRGGILSQPGAKLPRRRSPGGGDGAELCELLVFEHGAGRRRGGDAHASDPGCLVTSSESPSVLQLPSPPLSPHEY